MWSDKEVGYMQRALALARANLGKTLPNPSVGAVLVKNDQIIAEAVTSEGGGPHAEAQVLEKAKGNTQGATLFVTLEPCCHQGKNPPCTKAILEAGVSRVIVGYKDPNPLVSGRGINELQDAGIEVEGGLLGRDMEEFYAGFRSYILRHRPLVWIKIAQSLDGMIAGPNREPIKISGELARQWVLRLRSQMDGVIVGGQTVLLDNPALLAKEGNHKPSRIIFSKNCEIPLDSNIFRHNGAKVYWYSERKMEVPEPIDARQLPGGDFLENWRWMLESLGRIGMHQVLVEAGQEIANQVLSSDLWDRFIVITSPKLLGKGYSWRKSEGIDWSRTPSLSKFEVLEQDLIQEFRR